MTGRVRVGVAEYTSMIDQLFALYVKTMKLDSAHWSHNERGVVTNNVKPDVVVGLGRLYH